MVTLIPSLETIKAYSNILIEDKIFGGLTHKLLAEVSTGIRKKHREWKQRSSVLSKKLS